MYKINKNDTQETLETLELQFLKRITIFINVSTYFN